MNYNLVILDLMNNIWNLWIKLKEKILLNVNYLFEIIFFK